MKTSSICQSHFQAHIDGFDKLYRKACRDPLTISWADLTPNPGLISFLQEQSIFHTSESGIICAPPKALVVGCGLGDDAEALTQRGYKTIAFDVSQEAINWCQDRFPETETEYVTADLLSLPKKWQGHFDFVLESYTLQVLPPSLQQQAISALATTIAVGGILLVICRGRDPNQQKNMMPWPLTRDELAQFTNFGLEEVRFKDFYDREEPPVRRFCAVFTRP